MIYTTKTSSLNDVKCVKPSIASCNMLVTLSAVTFLDKFFSFLAKTIEKILDNLFFLV